MEDTAVAEDAVDDDISVSMPDDVVPTEPRPAWKPDISALPNAYEWVGGEPRLLVGVKDKIVIDYSALEAGLFLDTRCWVIDKVGEDGYLGLYDPHQRQYGCTNWITGPKRGLLIKIPGSASDLVGVGVMSRKGARRAVARALKEQRVADEAATKKTADAPGGEKKRGRGRPKGTINSKTRDRLVAAGHDPAKLTKQQIDEIMAGIRKAEYENAKAEKRRLKELKKDGR